MGITTVYYDQTVNGNNTVNRVQSMESKTEKNKTGIIGIEYGVSEEMAKTGASRVNRA